MSIHFTSSRLRLGNILMSAPGLPPAAPLTFDPDYLGNDAVLVEWNLGLRSTGGGWATARSTRSFPKSTKIYAEFDIQGDNNNCRIGLTSDRPKGEIQSGYYGPCVAPITNQMIYTDPDTGYRDPYGTIYGPQRDKVPDFVYIAWDGERFYFGRDGQWVNGNPSTGTGGTKALIPGDKFFINVSFADTPPRRILANFGATTFRYAPPAGYEGWAS